MPTNYAQTIQQLQQFVYRRGINYSLTNIRQVLAALGGAERPLGSVVHIAGTNGKGSTLTFLAAALQKAGYRVGTYLSPHVFAYTERMSCNGQPISTAKFCQYFELVRRCSAQQHLALTEFEILTLLAVLFFRDQQPDFLIVETGLGGRLDATMIFTPVLSLITKIDLDHQDLLGDSLAQIAAEKAGIIREQTPVLTLRQNAVVLAVIKQVARQQQAPCRVVSPVRQVPAHYLLQGEFQRQNLALAQAALRQLQRLGLVARAKQALLIQGLAQANIFGRYTRLLRRGATIIVDAAHNPAAIRILLATLQKDYPGVQPVFLFGALKRKNFAGMLQLLGPAAQKIYLCEFSESLACAQQDVAPAVSGVLVPVDLPTAKALYQAYQGSVPLVVTGSIYFIGELLAP